MVLANPTSLPSWLVVCLRGVLAQATRTKLDAEPSQDYQEQLDQKCDDFIVELASQLQLHLASDQIQPNAPPCADNSTEQRSNSAGANRVCGRARELVTPSARHQSMVWSLKRPYLVAGASKHCSVCGYFEHAPSSRQTKVRSHRYICLWGASERKSGQTNVHTSLYNIQACTCSYCLVTQLHCKQALWTFLSFCPFPGFTLPILCCCC